jgi:hypothetical protein
LEETFSTFRETPFAMVVTFFDDVDAEERITAFDVVFTVVADALTVMEITKAIIAMAISSIRLYRCIIQQILLCSRML